MKYVAVSLFLLLIEIQLFSDTQHFGEE